MHQYWFGESIAVFKTDDPSWCACSMVWANVPVPDGDDEVIIVIESDDEGCNSALRAISSYNKAHQTLF